MEIAQDQQAEWAKRSTSDDGEASGTVDYEVIYEPLFKHKFYPIGQFC